MSKTITASFVIIALVALAASAGTLAYFSDVESIDVNTFTAGTMDLILVDNGTPTFAEWYIKPNMKPGDFSFGGLKIYNVGTIEASELIIIFSVIETEGGTGDSDTLPTAVGMSKLLKVEDMAYVDIGSSTTQIVMIDNDEVKNDTSGDPYLIDLNDNGYIDLHDLSNTVLTVDAPPAVLDANGYDHKELAMKIRFVDDADYPDNAEKNNNYQGDTTELLVQFDLNQ
ncbi:MAG: SipW-dependent-type signal peptide-containing protein [Methanosarcinales archaeon]|nr:SipW-dependent-type signal peptide-containing protein [Methanosarcinales archaeon]